MNEDKKDSKENSIREGATKVEFDITNGSTIEDAVMQLRKYNLEGNGNLGYIEFYTNGQKYIIYSDEGFDDAYRKITGMTREEYMKGLEERGKKYNKNKEENEEISQEDEKDSKKDSIREGATKVEFDITNGNTIEDAVMQLRKYNLEGNGNLGYIEFYTNGQNYIIYSDEGFDDAYKKITGMTREEYDKEFEKRVSSDREKLEGKVNEARDEKVELTKEIEDTVIEIDSTRDREDELKRKQKSIESHVKE